MPIDFVEGFDYYPADPNVPGLGVYSTWTKSDLGGVDLVAGRFEARALRWGGNGGSATLSYKFTTTSQMVLGFAFKTNRDLGALLNNFGSLLGWIATPNDTGARQIEMRIDDLGVFKLVKPNPADYSQPLAILAQSKRRIVKNAWHYIELELESGDNGRAALYIDGELQFDMEVDTMAHAGQPFGRLTWFYTFYNNIDPIFDDLYILRDESTALGECRIQMLNPTADDTAEWTPLTGSDNYSMVNEVSADGDTTYNHTNTADAKDLFELNDITVNPTVVHAVAVNFAARKEDSATRIVRGIVESGGDEAEGPDFYLTDSYLWGRSILSLDPNGDIPWTKESVNAMKAGYKLVL